MNGIAITYGRSPVFRDGYRLLRRNLEWLTALAAFLLTLTFRGQIAERFAQQTWDIGAFYSAVFGWASIQAAFLFSVYAFFLSRSEPFIQAISKTQTFRDLRNYVLRALTLSMALTLLSLPLLVGSPSMSGGFGFVLFLVLSTLLAYTFMCFVKVIRVFRKLERVQD